MMKVNFIRARYTCLDPAVGVMFHRWGVRILLIWWHVIVRFHDAT